MVARTDEFPVENTYIGKLDISILNIRVGVTVEYRRRDARRHFQSGINNFNIILRRAAVAVDPPQVLRAMTLC